MHACTRAPCSYSIHVHARRYYSYAHVHIYMFISVTLQRGNAAFIRKWLDNCVPKSAAAQGDLDAEDASAAALGGGVSVRGVTGLPHTPRALDPPATHVSTPEI